MFYKYYLLHSTFLTSVYECHIENSTFPPSDYNFISRVKDALTEHPEWVRTLELLLLKKHEHSECIINAFDLAFAFETTRAKRVP